MNASTKRVVFYVDDDMDDVELLRNAFRIHTPDIELVSFGGVMELLSYINVQDQTSELPALIVMDMNMAGLSGRDGLRLLRVIDRYQKVPVVMFTTSNAQEDRYFAHHYNAGFITKPLNLHQMKEIVEEFISYCNTPVKTSSTL